MVLEDEISQRRFRSEYQKVVINIKHTRNWIDAQNTQRLRPFKLTPPLYHILGILRGRSGVPASIKSIRSAMLHPESNVSRLVEKLRKRGLVSRAEQRSDRRAVDVTISRDGLRLLSEVDKTEPEWVRKLRALTQAEAKTLNFLLDKLRSRDLSVKETSNRKEKKT